MGDVGIGVNRVIQDVDGETATVTSNRLDVNATIAISPSLVSFSQDTATTSVQTISDLIGSQVTVCKEIIIQADFDNPSFIMIGDAGVLSDDTEGMRLNAGDMLSLPISDTNNVSVRAPDGSQKLNISIIL